MVSKFAKVVDEDRESSVWNDAKNYVGGKIHVWLMKIDIYEELATFGFKEIDQDILIKNSILQSTARIKAMKRLIHAIQTLIRNTKFAVDKTSRGLFDEHRQRLKKIEKSLFKLKIEKKRGSKIIELSVDEVLFEKMMDELNEIIDDINQKINRAGLIFSQSEDFDIGKLKENLEREFTQ